MYRLAEDIKYRVNKTNRVIFLHGDNIEDVFYYNFNYGTLTLKDSVYYFFRDEYKCNIALGIDINLNINCFNKRTYSALDEHFYNKQENLNSSDDDFDLDELKHSGGAFKKGVKGSPIQKLSHLNDFLINFKGNKLLIIESFEWVAELFSFHIHNFDLIKLVYKWMNTLPNNVYVALVIKKPNVMENYYFNIEDDCFLPVKGAKPQEYFSALYRHLFLNYDNKIHMEKLENLSTAFKTNNFNLREAVTVFSKELKKHIKNNQPMIDLYPKFNNYFTTPIEEKIDIDDNLILDNDIKERLKVEFKNFIENKPEAKKGIILSGPPGTGKTLIAKSIASMGGFNFMPLKLSDLKQLYVGHSSAEVKNIFDKARSLEPTVMFIDEMDAVFPKRNEMMTDSFAKDITNEFIAQVDGVDTGKQRIFIIGATNIPEVLDSAVISRFDMQIIPLPKKPERERIFELYIPQLKENYWARVNKHTFLDKTEGLSGRDIKEISNTIKTKITETKSNLPTREIFDIALELFKEKVISTNKDKFEYVGQKTNRLKFSNIIGYRTLKKEIKSSIESVLRESELKYYNIEPERGILLEGPPGNGKSFIAQCIAGEFRLDFIKILSKDISSHLYSEDSKKIADIFDSASKIARLSKSGCVLFFDEFDGIAAKNTNLNLRATMLDLIVKSREIPNLILIAATNYKELLDEATIRDGRFDKKIRINNPSKADIFDLIREFLKETDKISKKNKIDNRISSEMYEKILDYFEKQRDNSTKSIAGIKSFSNNLKRQAFFNKRIDSNKVLIIDDDLVMDYINNIVIV